VLYLTGQRIYNHLKQVFSGSSVRRFGSRAWSLTSWTGGTVWTWWFL